MRASLKIPGLLACVIPLALGCGGKRASSRAAAPPPAAAQAPPAPTSPARPRPRLTRLAETLYVTCVPLIDKPCSLQAYDVAADGTIVTGGGHYGPVIIGGKQYPKGAYESLLIGAFDRDGRPLWSASKGTQWHNDIHDIRIVGDTIFITGVHANGFTWGPWKFPTKQTRKNADFEAELGYLGALRMDGTPLWAKNMELLVYGAEAKTTEMKLWPGAFLGSRELAPDGKGGVWVFTREGKANTEDRVWLVHVAPDGTALEKRELDLSGLSVMQGGRSVEVTPDGTAYCIATRNGEPRLVRLDAKGGRSEAPLPRMADQPAILALTAKGEAYVALSSAAWEGPVEHVVAYFARVSDAAPTWTRAVHEPIPVKKMRSEHHSLRAATYDEAAGELVLVMSHMEPLRIDGAELPATALLVSGSTPTGMTASVRMRSDGTVSAVGTFAQPYCIRHYPSGTLDVRAVAGSLLMRAGILQVEDLKGCMPAEKIGGLLVRIEERPAEMKP